MPQSIVQVDAFTSTPFAGNPAAVCVLGEPRDAAWMQLVAREMNLAETAFLRIRADGLASFWSRLLGKEEFLARQISARGGILKVRLQGDRVGLAGQATTVLRGELLA